MRSGFVQCAPPGVIAGGLVEGSFSLCDVMCAVLLLCAVCYTVGVVSQFRLYYLWGMLMYEGLHLQIGSFFFLALFFGILGFGFVAMGQFDLMGRRATRHGWCVCVCGRCAQMLEKQLAVCWSQRKQGIFCIGTFERGDLLVETFVSDACKVPLSFFSSIFACP